MRLLTLVSLAKGSKELSYASVAAGLQVEASGARPASLCAPAHVGHPPSVTSPAKTRGGGVGRSGARAQRHTAL